MERVSRVSVEPAVPRPSAEFGPPLGEGRPLGHHLQARIGGLLGADLSDVRVHRSVPGMTAAGMAIGRRVAFAPGVPSPDTREGMRILAHELCHIVQQAGGTGSKRLDSEAAAEAEAEAAVQALVDGASVGPLGAADPGKPQFVDLLSIRQQGFRPSPTGFLGLPLHYRVELDWNGDRFEVSLGREERQRPDPHGPLRFLTVDIRYIGQHLVDYRRVGWNDEHPALKTGRLITPVVTPVPGAADARSRSSRLDIDLFGDGSSTYMIHNQTLLFDAWVPPVRLHEFFDSRVTKGGFVQRVRESGALPVNEAGQLDALMAVPRPDVSKLSTRQILRVAEDRLYALRPEAWAAGRKVDRGLFTPLSRELLAAVRRVESSPVGQVLPDDAALRRKGSELARVSGRALTALTELAPLGRPEMYLGRTGDAAVALVHQAISSMVTAVFLSWSDRPDLLEPAERLAVRRRLALPYELAALYLRQGKGVDAVLSELKSVSEGLYNWRAMAALPMKRTLDGIIGLNDAGYWTYPARSSLKTLRDSYYAGGADVLANLEGLAGGTERVAGLLSILAMSAQMTWYVKELDSWIDPVVGAMPGTKEAQQPVAERYRDEFSALVAEVEGAWKDSWTPQFVAVVDSAISRFVSAVSDAKFGAAVDSLDDRLQTIEVVRLVGKVLALVAVAALTAGAAGGLVGTLLTSAGRGLALGPSLIAAIAKGGAFVAEVAVFTAVSRAGNAAFLGGNTTSYWEDLGTNFLMFRLLRFTSGVYAARWTQLRRLAQPIRYSAGQAGVSILSLHAFAELHHVYRRKVTQQGAAMSGEERFRVFFNNLVLVTAMHLGGHLVTPPESRIAAPVLERARRTYRTRFAEIEARRTQLADQLAKMRRDQNSVDQEAVLREIESLYNTEFTLIARAARGGGFSLAEVKAALDSYARPVRTIEIEFARMGMDFGPAEASMFRSLGGQFVEYRTDGLPYLREHYKAARGELTPIGEGMYRGKIGSETVYWTPRGGALPRGGMRGTTVFPLAGEPVLEPSDVAGLRGELVRTAATGGLRHRADFGLIPFPDSKSMRVPLEGGGFAPVELDIQIRTSSLPGAHGTESGHVRSDLRFQDGRWTAQFEIDPRLRREDAQLGLRHEANEVAGIVRRLHGSGLTGRAMQQSVLREQQAGLMRPGARGVEATAHDHATTIDLVSLFTRFERDPSPDNRTTLDAQVREMGFGARYFAQETTPGSMTPTSNVRTRDALVREHAANPATAERLLNHIDLWRSQTIQQTPLVAADRPSMVVRTGDYMEAIAGASGREGPFAGRSSAATMDGIEILAQTAMGRDRLTARDLVENGMAPGTAEQIVRSLSSRNPYRHLYAELESLIALRHRVAEAAARGETAEAAVGFGFRRQLVAVEQLTRGGRLDGAEFGEMMRRIEAAHEIKLLVPANEADPLRPRYGVPKDANSAVRLTWLFRRTPTSAVDSIFSVDLPGVVSGRPFQINDLMHADFEPAQPGGMGHGAQHVTETGVVVPAGSSPAHIWIKPDAAFGSYLDGWGLRAHRIRFKPGKP